MDPHDIFWHFVNERHAIYLRRFVDKEPRNPVTGGWTSDPILSRYSFCNVFRELDRVTIWIDEHIRTRFANHPNLWLMLAIARTINWPDTLAYLIDCSDERAWPALSAFHPKGLGDALDGYSATGKKVYTGAYMIRAESDQNKPWFSWTKQQYVAQIVIGKLWEKRFEFSDLFRGGGMRPSMQYPRQPTLQEVHAWLASFHGWGPFMAYQVVVDLRWTPYLRNARDIQTWAALGPGSRRGLNRLYGRPVDFNLSQKDGLPEMLRLHQSQDQFRAPHVPPIDLSDIQNCLCEFDKYSRVKFGEGKPRALFKPRQQEAAL